jgi:hypothetical protein
MSTSLSGRGCGPGWRKVPIADGEPTVNRLGAAYTQPLGCQGRRDAPPLPTVAADGTGLPPGSGTVQQGEALFAPQSPTPDEIYALCAYLPYPNGIVAEDAVMDDQTVPQVVMPNHAGFTSPDPRPNVFKTVPTAPIDMPEA